ncbi:hypothetical protein ACIBHY_08590 [Nonomuraea sp. NPDC050547]|uniref:hypothetical protein n=1 Tax=Nonomuraea sp. NPDC050547 TaxID=3364368 RepID=UPI0037BBC2FA
MKTSTRYILAGGAVAALTLSFVSTAHAGTRSTVTLPTAAAFTAIPTFKAPKIFGTTFQADPGHDFTKGVHSRRDGILRGWITHVSGVKADYEPIKWKKGTQTEGHFVGPPEGDVRAYSSPIAKNVVFLSAFGCKASMQNMTVDRNTGLGNKRCSRSVLIKRAKQYERPALITVYKGKIVRVQEIYTP